MPDVGKAARSIAIPLPAPRGTPPPATASVAEPEDTFGLDSATRALGTNLDTLDRSAVRAVETKAAAAETKATATLSEARSRLTAATQALGDGNVPALPVRDLQAQKAALMEQKPALGARITADEAKVKDIDAKKAALKAEVLRALPTVKQHAKRNLPGSVAMYEGQIERVTEQAAKLEDGPKKQELTDELDRLTAGLGHLKTDLATLKAAQGVIDHAATVGPQLDTARAAATADIADAKAKLQGLDAGAATLDRQVSYVGVKAEVDGDTSALAHVRTVEQTLQGKELSLDARDASDRDSIARATTLAGAAEDAGDHAKSLVSNGSVRMYQKADAVEQAVDQGHLKRKNVDMERLTSNKDILGRQIREAAAGRETTSQAVVEQLKDPAFIKTMGRMEDGPRAELMGRLLTSIAGTQAGETFLHQNLTPVLELGPDALKQLSGENNPFVSLYQNSKSLPKTATTTLESVGSFLATEAGKSSHRDLVGQAMIMSLALRPGQLDTVEEAVGLMSSGQPEQAKSLLSAKGLADAAKSLKPITRAFTVVSAAAAVAALVKHPDLSNALKAGKSGADLTKAATDVAKNLPAFQRWKTVMGTTGNVAERVAAPIQIFVSLYDTWKSGGSVDRGDVGGTVGKSLMAGGAIVTTVGLAFDSTVVGAVAGVPLNVIGGVIAGVGAGVDFVFGDNDTEKWLKANAPEYLRR